MDDNTRNDRIHKITADLGYCCPYGFFGCNQRKSDSTAKLALKLKMSDSAVKFNKRKLRSGELTCEKRNGCQEYLFPKPFNPTGEE